METQKIGQFEQSESINLSHPDFDTEKPDETKVAAHINRLFEEAGAVAEKIKALEMEELDVAKAVELTDLHKRIATIITLIESSRTEKRIVNDLEQKSSSEQPSLELFRSTIARIEEKTGNIVTQLSNWRPYEVIDGELNGVFKLNKKWMPVINGELIEDFGPDMTVENCFSAKNINGLMNGVVKIGGRYLPVIEGELIEDFGPDYKILNCGDVVNIDGKMNGWIEVEHRLPDNSNGEWKIPVIDGRPVERINDGRLISRCGEIENIDGKLNGRVELDGDRKSNSDFSGFWGKFMPIIYGTVIEKLDSGQKIDNCMEVKNINGKLNCMARIGREWLPVVNDKLLDDFCPLGWITNFSLKFDNDTLNGRVNIRRLNKSEIWLPVIDGEIIEELEPGKPIYGCDNIKIINGKLNGSINTKCVLPDGSESVRIFPVINGVLIESLGADKKIEMCLNVHNVDGKLNCLAQIDGKRYPVINGVLIDTLENGLKIEDCTFTSEIEGAFNVAGTLNGRFKVIEKQPDGQGKEKWCTVVLGKIVKIE